MVTAGRSWSTTRTLSTPSAIPSGFLADSSQPALPATGRLLLRPWEPADAPAFLSAYQDHEIRRWHTRRPATEPQVRVRRIPPGLGTRDGGHWAITRDDGQMLGRIALRGLDFDDGIAGAAYWMLPAARGAGAASRALTALTAWALDEIGFHRLQLDHSTRNHASCRVATKSGYLLEGTKRSAAVHDDGRHDMHLHAHTQGD
ncbi:Protein N-acetyltransferase, RimJ/RimL family [Streptomyces sp. OV198]|nr:Protein N-acetyltransferase, RimJ/RimL family [Streptomyces sp. OV198]